MGQTKYSRMETRTTKSTTVVSTMCSRKGAILRTVPLISPLSLAHRTVTSRSALTKLRVEVSVRQTKCCPMETRSMTSTTVVGTTCSRKSAAFKVLPASAAFRSFSNDIGKSCCSDRMYCYMECSSLKHSNGQSDYLT